MTAYSHHVKDCECNGCLPPITATQEPDKLTTTRHRRHAFQLEIIYPAMMAELTGEDPENYRNRPFDMEYLFFDPSKPLPNPDWEERIQPRRITDWEERMTWQHD